jgi:hypothetical protein
MLGLLKALGPKTHHVPTAPRRRSACRPALEVLEERQMLSQMVSMISPIGNQDGTGAAQVRTYGPIMN